MNAALADAPLLLASIWEISLPAFDEGAAVFRRKRTESGVLVYKGSAHFCAASPEERAKTMDVQSLVSEFLSSEHGQGAAAALAAQGVSSNDAQTLLTHAATAGAEHVEESGGGLLGEHAGKSFFSAFAAGLVKGDGLFGALGDGAEGVLVGRITEALASRAGLDPSTASSIAAAATPFVAAFFKSKLGI